MEKYVGYGISPKLGMDLDWSDAPYNWQLHFVQFPRKKEEAEAHSQIMAWIAAGALKPSDFISNVFEFDHILDAFGLVEKRLPDTKKSGNSIFLNWNYTVYYTRRGENDEDIKIIHDIT